jgi:beta-lactamase superfamily II metal-dependent hydrolase
MTENLPTVRRQPPETPRANNEEDCVIVSQWRDDEAVVMGNCTKGNEEWLKAPYSLDLLNCR